MASGLGVALLPGTPDLLAAQAAELPQQDELCAPFWGLVALRAAGVTAWHDEPLHQRGLAVAAGTRLSAGSPPLPPGEPGRSEPRPALPVAARPDQAGTSAPGLAAAITRLSAGRLTAVPASGRWTPARLGRLLHGLAAQPEPVTCIANLDAGLLWGSHAGPVELLGHLLSGRTDGPPPDWMPGHFVALVAVVTGPAGELVVVADSYPSLGARGVHPQPLTAVAAALGRREPAGGLLLVARSRLAEGLADLVGRSGLVAAMWDNGTPPPQETGSSPGSPANATSPRPST